MQKILLKIRQITIKLVDAWKLPFFSTPKGHKMIEAVTEPSFVRYLIIGFSTFALDFLIFTNLEKFTPITGLWANITSTGLTMLYNFPMSNHWTFKSGKSEQKRKMRKYLSLAIFNYIFNNLMFYVLSTTFGIPGLITKVIVTALIVCWNYFLYKFWIFKI